MFKRSEDFTLMQIRRIKGKYRASVNLSGKLPYLKDKRIPAPLSDPQANFLVYRNTVQF